MGRSIRRAVSGPDGRQRVVDGCGQQIGMCLREDQGGTDLEDVGLRSGRTEQHAFVFAQAIDQALRQRAGGLPFGGIGYQFDAGELACAPDVAQRRVPLRHLA